MTHLYLYVLPSGFALDARINALEKSFQTPIFSLVDWTIYDSHMDNSSVHNLVIVSRPSSWKLAVYVRVHRDSAVLYVVKLIT